MRRWGVVVLVIVVGLALLACGTSNMWCYSTYPGCEETAIAIATKWAAPLATATALAR